MLLSLRFLSSSLLLLLSLPLRVATLRTGCDFVPTSLPFLPPSERAVAHHADFFRQIFFLHTRGHSICHFFSHRLSSLTGIRGRADVVRRRRERRMTTTPPLLIPETAKEKRLQRRRRRDFHRAHAFWVVRVGSLKAAVCLSLSLSFERSSSRRSEKAYTVGVEKLFLLTDFPKRKRSF